MTPRLSPAQVRLLEAAEWGRQLDDLERVANWQTTNWGYNHGYFEHWHSKDGRVYVAPTAAGRAALAAHRAREEARK